METKSYQAKNDTQELVDDIFVTQEPTVEVEADYGEKETVTKNPLMTLLLHKNQ